MTKTFINLMGLPALDKRDGEPMKLDLFERSLWRRKMSDPADDGTVKVTLSTGKTVTVNSRFLGLLRVLAEELAKDEAKPH